MISPLRAVNEELSRSFDFSGRTARAHYLWFLLASMALFIGLSGLTLTLLSNARTAEVILVLVIAFYVPVTSAGVRRLHDIGHSGTAMLDPLKPTITVIVLFLILAAFVEQSAAASSALVLGVLLAPLPIIVLALLVVAPVTFMTALYFSNTMGLLLLPSEPGPNKYGPNPNEVPQ